MFGFLHMGEPSEHGVGCAAWQNDFESSVEGYFKHIEKLSRDNKFKVLLVTFPFSFQIYSEYLEDEPQRILRKNALKFNVDFLDLLELLRDNNDKQLFFDQCHPLESTNALIGKAIAEHVVHNIS